MNLHSAPFNLWFGRAALAAPATVHRYFYSPTVHSLPFLFSCFYSYEYSASIKNKEKNKTLLIETERRKLDYIYLLYVLHGEKAKLKNNQPFRMANQQILFYVNGQADDFNFVSIQRIWFHFNWIGIRVWLCIHTTPKCIGYTHTDTTCVEWKGMPSGHKWKRSKADGNTKPAPLCARTINKNKMTICLMIGMWE